MNWKGQVARCWLGLIVVVGLLSPLLANDAPLYVRAGGKVRYPALRSVLGSSPFSTIIEGMGGETVLVSGFSKSQWMDAEVDQLIWAPIPYSATSQDPFNRNYSPPGSQSMVVIDKDSTVDLGGHFNHHLGTDGIGRDVLAGMIAGSQTALWVGLGTVFIAGLLGISLGAVGGYSAGNGFSTNRWCMVFGFVEVLYVMWLFGYGPMRGFSSAYSLLLTLFGVGILGLGLNIILGKLTKRSVPIHVYPDKLITYLITLFDSLPRLLWVLLLSAVLGNRSLMGVVLILGIAGFTSVARFTRGEVLRAREQGYVMAARTLGIKDLRIFIGHILPNILPALGVIMTLAMIGGIVGESTLSFLGLGLPVNQVSWGSLLGAGRSQPFAWWLFVWPALALSITLWALTTLTEKRVKS